MWQMFLGRSTVNGYEKILKDRPAELKNNDLESKVSSLEKEIEQLKKEASRSLQAEEKLQERTHELGERVKELNCLYDITSLANRQSISLDEIFRHAVKILPSAWQYPEIARARIRLNGAEYTTEDFRETRWRQARAIYSGEEFLGELEVFYLEETAGRGEGPFMDEERNLLNAVAEHIGMIIKRRRAEDALRESEEIHRVTLSNISDAVFLTDDTGSFTYICPNVHIIFGYTVQEVHDAENISALLGGGLFNRGDLDTVGEIVNIERNINDKYMRSHSLLVNVKKVSIKTGTVLYTCRDITDRKLAEEALKESENQLRALSRKIISAQEEERSKLSRELHDELGHQLATLRLEIDWIKKHLNPENTGEKLENLTKMVLGTTAGLRQICKGLRPMITDYMGLGLAVEALAEEFGSRGGFQVNLSINPMDDCDFDHDIAISIYRILQETFTNVARHSGAGNVSITLDREENDIVLKVEDDGRGMDEQHHGGRGGLGIIGMRERAALCGGKLEIESVPGGGVRVTMRVATGGK